MKLAVPDEPLNILEEYASNMLRRKRKTAEKEEREQGTAVTVAETSLKHATEQREKVRKRKLQSMKSSLKNGKILT